MNSIACFAQVGLSGFWVNSIEIQASYFSARSTSTMSRHR